MHKIVIVTEKQSFFESAKFQSDILLRGGIVFLTGSRGLPPAIPTP